MLDATSLVILSRQIHEERLAAAAADRQWRELQPGRNLGETLRYLLSLATRRAPTTPLSATTEAPVSA